MDPIKTTFFSLTNELAKTPQEQKSDLLAKRVNELCLKVLDGKRTSSFSIITKGPGLSGDPVIILPDNALVFKYTYKNEFRTNLMYQRVLSIFKKVMKTDEAVNFLQVMNALVIINPKKNRSSLVDLCQEYDIKIPVWANIIMVCEFVKGAPLKDFFASDQYKALPDDRMNLLFCQLGYIAAMDFLFSNEDRIIAVKDIDDDEVDDETLEIEDLVSDGENIEVLDDGEIIHDEGGLQEEQTTERALIKSNMGNIMIDLSGDKHILYLIDNGTSTYQKITSAVLERIRKDPKRVIESIYDEAYKCLSQFFLDKETAPIFLKAHLEQLKNGIKRVISYVESVEQEIKKSSGSS